MPTAMLPLQYLLMPLAALALVCPPAACAVSCPDARSRLENIIAALPDTCEQDADCGCYDYRVFPGAPPAMLRVPGQAPDGGRLLSEAQEAVREACRGQLSLSPREEIACAPVCRAGRCANAGATRPAKPPVSGQAGAMLSSGWRKFKGFFSRPAARRQQRAERFVYRPPLWERLLYIPLKILLFVVTHPLIFGLLAVAGLLFGRFRENWEEGLPREAYPAAVRLSWWAGLLGAAGFFLFGLKNINPGDQLAALAVFATLFITPLAGLAACGVTRPLFYLAALLYYKRRGAKGASK